MEELEIEVDVRDSLVKRVSPVNGTGSKKCKKCGVLKPLSQYHGHYLAKDGHIGTCNTCYNKHFADKKLPKVEAMPVPVESPTVWAILPPEQPVKKSSNSALFTILQMAIEELEFGDRDKLVAMIAAYNEEER